jgi:hypothetical protein
MANHGRTCVPKIPLPVGSIPRIMSHRTIFFHPPQRGCPLGETEATSAKCNRFHPRWGDAYRSNIEAARGGGYLFTGNDSLCAAAHCARFNGRRVKGLLDVAYVGKWPGRQGWDASRKRFSLAGGARTISF